MSEATLETKTTARMPSRAATSLKFGGGNGFGRVLKQRVEDYFERSGRAPRDCPRMYIKSIVTLCWLVSLYVLLVFYTQTWWQALPLAILLGLSVAAVGFNIQHDGGHGAYSRSRSINKLAAMTLDLVGGSSYIWARKHNSIHHSFSNITGHDDDINIGFLGRLSPHQKHLRFHRFQHFYLWLLYGFLPVKWQGYDDFRDLIRARIGEHKFKRPRGWDLVVFWGGKAAFFGLAFVVPMLLHPWWVVVLLYLAAAYVQGVVLSVVFQMAHCVEEAEFPMPVGEPSRMENEWAVHQVQTTVDFARGNRVLSWFIGGLNFQIEHHLFPQICHTNYPALAPVVEQTCKEFGLRYNAHPTLRSSLASHFRWLRRMGMAEGVS